jgi:pyruvate,water dikinase
VSYIVGFDEQGSVEQSLVGGKAANLGRLTAAGFNVPPGFSVTTEAYNAFFAADGRGEQAAKILADVDYGDADAVEAATESVRQLILAPDLPADIADPILAAYAELGDGGAAVAVRSSGTAEDLEGASFAGLHDTYLEIAGDDQVLAAIQRCWASLWSARATAYRHDQDYAATEAQIAVVVQLMVDSETAGVMFTANPVTGAVDETIVNASWGLGEAVVSGMVTPDEFALDRATKRLRRHTIGDKNVRVVRKGDGSGTVEEPIAAAEAGARTLDDEALAELGLLGQRVTEYYEGFPQDIEWARSGGVFYLLQSRPVTGVELSWDEDLEYFHYGSEEDPDREDFIYTRAWSDDFSIAAVTPLYYTTRSKEWSDNYHIAQVLWGNEKAGRLRSWKYHKGEAYFSANMEAAWLPEVLPPYLREPGTMNKVPPTWWDELEKAPFSWLEYIRIYARIQFLDGRSGPYRYVAAFKERSDDEVEGNGVPNEELAAMSDEALERYLNHRLDLWRDADADQWGSFFLYAPFAMGTMAHFLVRWYDGDIGQAFAELLSGLPQASITLVENHEIWQLSEKIKASPLLRKLLDEYRDDAFFAELANHEEGREFLAEYEPWKIKRGHRGAGDRDFTLPRRLDDASIDYNAFVALMAGDSNDPLANEELHRRKREEREDEVYAQMSKGLMGPLRLEAFKAVQSWSLGFMAHRDNEREYLDRLAYVQRRCFLEIGGRLADRGQIAETMDVFYLGLEEAYEMLHGNANERLFLAKIEGRKRNFLRRQRLDVVLPPYISQNGAPALPGQLIGSISSTDSSEEDGKKILPGGGTSGGTITGRARVIKDLKDIGRLEKGDILICHATDPGWTPVFLVIGGLVMQTGGVLAHGSCLSREYGLPAVVVPEAMSRIEDGATITIDGDLGRVAIHAEENGAASSNGSSD